MVFRPIKTIRFYLRLTIALIRKYYLVLVVGAVFGSLTFFTFPYVNKFMPRLRGVETIAVVGRYTPSDIPIFIQSQISQGLTTLDPSGLPTPAIATSWEISDDGKTYTFKLDPNVSWQDGTTLTASDINYQFRDATTEYRGEGELVMSLTDPFAPLPVVVSRPIFKRGLLGTGSYQVSRIKKNGDLIDSLTLTPTQRDTRQPHLTYRFYATEAAARLAFKLGVVRSIIDLQEVADLDGWENATITPQRHEDRYVAVFFNTQSPDFSGPGGRDLRLALAYAIDKGHWEDRVYGPINPASWAYYPDIKRFDYDLTRAQQLIDKVGETPELITLSTVPAYLEAAEVIKSDWEKLGLKVNVVVAAEPTADFQALVIAQQIPQDPDQYNLWHSTQATNLTALDNPRIDKLLEDGRKSTDIDQRKKLYLDFQRYLVDEVPAIFLFHPTSYTVSRK